MNEYKNKSALDLTKLLAEKREAFRAFRFGITGSTKKNVKVGMLARKDIARILTEKNLLKKKEPSRATS